MKTFEEFVKESLVAIRHDNGHLPMASLEWDFWNQSGAKILNDKYTCETYLDINKDNIAYIEKTENISIEDIKSKLKYLWDEARKEEYVDMRKNERDFITAIEKYGK